MQKTIFITITRSFITRNILRCGTLDLLKKRGYRVVVFFAAPTIPEYLEAEFVCDQVELVALPLEPRNKLHRFLMGQGVYLISTVTSRMLAFYKERLKQHLMLKKLPVSIVVLPHIRLFFLQVVSRMRLVKALYRYIDVTFFPEKDKEVITYFNTYSPDIVFSTSIDSRLDIAMLKEAKRRGVTTVSMPKSWDCLHSMYYRFIPDYFLVPNEVGKEAAVQIQDIPTQNISVIGLPQFDWYTRKDIIKSREEYCQSKGLDPNRSLIFFGSEGIWAPHDAGIAEQIYQWIQNNELAKPSQLLARAHYSNCDQNIFRALQGKAHVCIDTYRITNFLSDTWDPSVEEMVDFINSLYHCDIMVNAASTLTLDAVCFDKPVINVHFGCVYEEGNIHGKDVTWTLYKSDHFEWVLETGATRKVDTPQDFKEQMNRYLADPSLDADQREVLRKKLCYRVDGGSSQRLVDALDAVLTKGASSDYYKELQN